MADADKNDWKIYQSLLGGKGNPPRESQVGTGYWRQPHGRDGTATPIATWWDSGMWLASIDGRDIDVDDDAWAGFVAKTWPSLIAVPMQHYETARDAGKWPDGTPVRARQVGIGDNSGAAEKDILALAKNEIEKAEALVKAGPAKTEDAADLASNMARAMTTTKGKVIAEHKVKKEPSLEEGRRIDQLYFPTRDRLADLAADLKSKVINPFQVEQDRLARIKREAEAAEAKRLQDIEDAKALQAAEAGRVPEPQPSAAFNPLGIGAAPSRPARVSTGSRGAKVTLRPVKYGVITDAAKFGTWLLSLESPDPRIIVLLEAAANKIARNDAYKEGDEPAPGMKVTVRQESI